jgi:D-alanine-D-alanine ligase
MKVLIVHDRLSDHPSKDELDTLLEVEQVASALTAGGYLVDLYAFSLDFSLLEKKVETFHPDVVFNLVETLQGSQWLHIAPAFFEKLNLPFTGCGSRGMFLTSDKLLAKQLMKLSSIPTPFWVERGKTEDLPLLLGVPVIVKPVSEEASVGITDDSVQTFLTGDSLLGFLGEKDCFAEQYIEGREFNLSVYMDKGKPKVLPPAEMLFLDYPKDKPEIAGYEAKWEEDSFAYTHTVRTFDFPDSDQPLLARLKELSLQCWDLFSAKGYARIDFRVDKKGNAYVLEVNMNPCIASDSGFTAACAKEGLSYTAMIEQIVRGC